MARQLPSLAPRCGVGILHTTATDDLPGFIEQLRRVLNEVDNDR